MIKATQLTFAVLFSVVAITNAENWKPSIDWLKGASSNVIVSKAKAWENKYYRPGVSRQCANFVGEVMSSAGIQPPPGHSLARNWLKFGRPVVGSPRPGDIIVQWRGSRSGTAGHILIYVGNGQCIHRPTYSRAVSRVSLESCKPRILGIRRAR